MLKSLANLRLLFERHDLRWFGALFASILAMAFLEVAGIASILPFMHLVANPDLLHENRWLRWVYTTMSFSSQRTMLIWTGCVVLVLITASRLFTAFTTWMIHKCVWSIAHRLCLRLVTNYTKLPYEFFLAHHSTQLQKKVMIDVNNFVTGVLLAGSSLIAYATLAVVICLLLVVVDPVLSMSAMGVFGGAYVLIYLIHHRYLKRLGQDRLKAVYGRFRTFADAISGVKTIRTEGAAPFFIKRFEQASASYSEIHPKYQLVLIFPRLIVELLAFGAILVMILALLSAGNDLSASIPVLSLFAVASYRLLPALTKAFAGAAQLSHHWPVIDDVYRDMRQDQQAPPTPSGMRGDPIGFEREIQVRGVGFRYENTTVDILSDINLTVEKGQKVAIIGSTGSGKSTLIDVMVGLLWPGAGGLVVDGTTVSERNVARWWEKIAYVPQEVFLFDEAITRNIAFGIDPDQIDMDRVRGAARMAQIDGFITEQLPDRYDSMIGERGVRLSGGQRQRLGLARALYRRPEVLFLDEATSALDGVTEKSVMNAMTQGLPGLTMIMVAHRLSTVKGCDRIVYMDQGRIVAEGGYDDLMVSNGNFRQMVQLSEA